MITNKIITVTDAVVDAYESLSEIAKTDLGLTFIHSLLMDVKSSRFDVKNYMMAYTSMDDKITYDFVDKFINTVDLSKIPSEQIMNIHSFIDYKLLTINTSLYDLYRHTLKEILKRRGIIKDNIFYDGVTKFFNRDYKTIECKVFNAFLTIHSLYNKIYSQPKTALYIFIYVCDGLIKNMTLNEIIIYVRNELRHYYTFYGISFTKKIIVFKALDKYDIDLGFYMEYDDDMKRYSLVKLLKLCHRLSSML